MKSLGNDTIAAVATGAGGGIGIVRISGPDALPIAGRMFRSRGGRPLETAAPFLLVLGLVTDPASSESIDEALAAHMPAGRSYTGESTVEIQAHGGRVVLEAVLRAALRAGARHADPGEFTKRAFLSGRLDLTQAEAVAELIGAESEEAHRRALQTLQGGVAGSVNVLRDRLLNLVARVEAALDFEEEGLTDDLPSAEQVVSLARDIRGLASLASGPTGDPGGIRVVFAGPPNSGKSSIFNYLLDYDRSIVAAAPGTTRDYIEERFMVGGATVTLIDTAGFREVDDAVEAEGVRRSIRLIAEADIVVLVVDGSEPTHPDYPKLRELSSCRPSMAVISKCDLPLRVDREDLRSRSANLPLVTLSTVTGAGFSEFAAALASLCHVVRQSAPAPTVAPNLRHRNSLERAAGHLDAISERGLAEEGLLDQMALELRAALSVLGEITGETATEEILERIFSRFCVGK